jgi:hypothetical protein
MAHSTNARKKSRRLVNEVAGSMLMVIARRPSAEARKARALAYVRSPAARRQSVSAPPPGGLGQTRGGGFGSPAGLYYTGFRGADTSLRPPPDWRMVKCLRARSE